METSILKTRLLPITVLLIMIAIGLFAANTSAQSDVPDFSTPYMGVERAIGTRPLLVILLQSADPSARPVRTRDEIRQLIFGDTDSVRSYYLENSYGQFTFVEAYTTEWLTAVDDPSTAADESSFDDFYRPDRLEEKSAWVIQQVEPLTDYQFQFSQYDRNLDHLVKRDELAILWVYPGPSGGRERGTIPAPVPVDSLYAGVNSTTGMVNSSGVLMRLARLADGAPDFVELVAHELGHQALGLDDLYDNSDIGYLGNSFFSLMAYHQSRSHLDPWAKIKLGWITPTVITGDGWYPLHDIETYPEAYILYNPNRGSREYFIVENRFPGTSLESGLTDQGIGIWHITEFGAEDYWGRRAINLEWSGGTPSSATASDGAFWDGSDPNAGYDFTPSSSPTNSRWADGASSDIAIRCIPASAPTVQVFFDIPPLRDSTVVTSPPAVLNAPDGSLSSVFALGSDGAIYQNVLNYNTMNWGTWSQLPGWDRFIAAPAAINSPDGSLASVFALQEGRSIYQIVYNRNTSTWGEWTSLPGYQWFVSAPAAMNSPDGSTASVFALGDDGYIYQIVYNRNTSTWGEWSTLPGGLRLVSAPAVMNSPDGSLASVFALGENGAIYQIVYNRNTSMWGEWTSLPGYHRFVSAPAVMNSPDGSLAEIFAAGEDGSVYQLVYNRNVSAWSEWSRLPTSPWSITDAPAAINAPDGAYVNVFTLGINGAIYQTMYNQFVGVWTDWFSITEPVSVCS